jgi:folate-binding protein YgfZ
MNPLRLQEFHRGLGARFTEANGAQAVNDYGDWPAELAALRETAGVLDLGFRSRLCLAGADRARFLHGQVTNDVNRLRLGGGCYAAITNAKGKMEGDAKVFCLADEILLDLEPGLAGKISQRMEKYIVADDVQVVDAAPHYGLLSVQGPKAAEVVLGLGWFTALPALPLTSATHSDAELGEIVLANHARFEPLGGLPRNAGSPPVSGPAGFDLFVPNESLPLVAERLLALVQARGGRACGWQAYETARIEMGIPRFGADMDESNIPLECGIEARAISYTKGCYIGQEVINRIHSVGHVNRELRGFRLADDLRPLPSRGAKLLQGDREVGHLTSAVHSPRLRANIALGYARRECNQIGAELTLATADGLSSVRIVELPFAQ